MSSTEGEGHSNPADSVLFIIVCFTVALATQRFLGWVPVPLTGLLLVWGLCIGALQAIPPATHLFTASLQMWLGMDPALLLLIFLPTIGFSAGVGQLPHLLRRNWPTIVMLAFPGTVITFGLIGVAAKYFFPYNWTWPEALLFGAMLSATDPVAVVAVLTECGASDELRNIIDGESLLNDGSALVIFGVMQSFVQGEALTAAQVAVEFVRLALGGAAVGVVCGFATYFWLRSTMRDAVPALMVTFTSAYASYFLSEEVFGASGMLAVVLNGFTLSVVGGREVTERVQHAYHAFWGALEWSANSLLFVWQGIVLMYVMLPFGEDQELKLYVHLAPIDGAYAVVLYLWLLVARTVMLAVFLPLMSTGRFGYPVDWRAALVMAWGGLRGAVGVAMSLFILLDPLITNSEFKAHSAFFMGWMALLTVIINGSTARWLLTTLGLLDKTPEQIDMLRHVVANMDEICEGTIDDARGGGGGGGGGAQETAALGVAEGGAAAAKEGGSVLRAAVDPGVVRALADSGARGVVARAEQLAALRMRKAGGGGSSSLDALHQRRRVGAIKRQHPSFSLWGKGQAASAREWPELVVAFRRRLLRMVKSEYAHLYGRFQMPTGTVTKLQEAADAASDLAPSCQLCDWKLMQHTLKMPWWLGSAQSAAGVPLVGRPARGAVRSARLARLAGVAAFCQAHAAAQAELRAYVEECGEEGASAGPPGQAAQAAQAVVAESAAQVAAAETFAKEGLLPADASLTTLLASRCVAIEALLRQGELLEHIREAGLVSDAEVGELQSCIDGALTRAAHAHEAPAGVGGDPQGAVTVAAAATAAVAGEDATESAARRAPLPGLPRLASMRPVSPAGVGGGGGGMRRSQTLAGVGGL